MTVTTVNRTPIACARCGRQDQGHGRGLCGGCAYQCRRDGTIADWPRVKHPAEEVLEEVLHAAGKRTPQEVADALGVTTGSVARTLHRLNRHDLAGPYQRAYDRSRYHSRKEVR